MFQIGSADIRSLEPHHDMINCFCHSETVQLRGSIAFFDRIAKIMDTSLVIRAASLRLLPDVHARSIYQLFLLGP
jgi:hypothetical protein